MRFSLPQSNTFIFTMFLLLSSRTGSQPTTKNQTLDKDLYSDPEIIERRFEQMQATLNQQQVKTKSLRRELDSHDSYDSTDMTKLCLAYSRLPAPKTTTACPNPFELNNAANSCYKLMTQSYSWDEAGLVCSSLYPHAHLAFISSSTENDAIRDLINALPATTTANCHHHHHGWSGKTWWIGGQRINPYIRSDFVWKTTCRKVIPMNYANWAPTEPNGAMNAAVPESCVHLLPSGLWNDYQCALTLCAVCEVDM